MAGTWCPDCRAFMADGTTCPECRRRLAWGTILGAAYLGMTFEPSGTGVGIRPNQAGLAVIGAVAILMQERQALLHQLRKQAVEDQRAAQRGSSEAYDDGRDAGRREGRGDW